MTRAERWALERLERAEAAKATARANLQAAREAVARALHNWERARERRHG